MLVLLVCVPHFCSYVLFIFHITLLPQQRIFSQHDQYGNVLTVHVLWFCRQGGKDQAKKGSNIKLGPQGDKKGLGQDPRKDSSIDGGHHLKVMYPDKRNIYS